MVQNFSSLSSLKEKIMLILLGLKENFKFRFENLEVGIKYPL